MIEGRIEDGTLGLLRGWAWDPSRPDQQLDLEVLIDGQSSGIARASLRRLDLVKAGVGGGNHGFEFVIPLLWRDGLPHRVSLALPNEGEVAAIAGKTLNFGKTAHAVIGKVERTVAGKVFGWAWNRASPTVRIELEVFVRGRFVERVVADRPRGDLLRAGIGDGQHGFEIRLDPSLVDGDENVLLAVKTADIHGGQLVGAIDVGVAAPQVVRAVVATEAARPVVDPVEVTAAEFEPRSTVEAAVKVEESLPDKEAIKRATDLEASGELQSAFEILKAILERDSRNFEARFRLARVCLALGLSEEAKTHALQALLSKPNHAKPSIILARVAEMKGERLLALEYWKNVPAKDSAYMERLLKSARMLIALERPGEAKELLSQAMAHKSSDVRPAHALAQLLEDTDDRENALKLWREIAGLEPLDTTVRRKIDKLNSASPLSDARRTFRRYGGAMSRAESLVALAVGPNILDVLGSDALAQQMALHFGTRIRIILPDGFSYAEQWFANSAAVSDVVTTCSTSPVSELLFILPEYLTATIGAAEPRAGLCFNFLMEGRVPSTAASLRYESYLRWIEDIAGLDHSMWKSSQETITGDINSILVAFNEAESMQGIVLNTLGDRFPHAALMAMDAKNCTASETIASLDSLKDDRTAVITTDAVIGHVAAALKIRTLLCCDGPDILPHMAGSMCILPAVTSEGLKLALESIVAELTPRISVENLQS